MGRSLGREHEAGVPLDPAVSWKDREPRSRPLGIAKRLVYDGRSLLAASQLGGPRHFGGKPLLFVAASFAFRLVLLRPLDANFVAGGQCYEQDAGHFRCIADRDFDPTAGARRFDDDLARGPPSNVTNR